MSESNAIINALKRMERAGSKESRATEKLRASALTISRHIAARMPEDVGTREEDVLLPGGYAVDYPVNGQHLELAEWHSSDRWLPVGSDRQSALKFAQAVATGWLDELATWLEKRAAEAVAAATTLDNAAEGERG